MIADYCYDELWDMIDTYINKAFHAMTQENVVWLIIQSVLIMFSVWDESSRFFVLLSAVGLYSIYGSFSVWINIRRTELEEKKQSESKYRQYRLAVNLRHKNLSCDEILFIPEINTDEDYFNKSHCANDMYTEYSNTMNFERNYLYV